MGMNYSAVEALKNAGISEAQWARHAGWPDGEWRGDDCGCWDDRCIGHHHDEYEDCNCLGSLIQDHTAATAASTEGQA